MTTWAAVLSNLKGYAGKPNDDTYLKLAIVQALRQLRSTRTHWSEGSFQFYTEALKSEYTYGYPGFPDDFLAFDNVFSSTSSVDGTGVIAATAIGADEAKIEKNGETDAVALAWLTADRPYDINPRTDHSWLPTSGSGSVVYEVKFATPGAAIPNGTGKNIIHFNAKQVGTPTSVVISVVDKFGTDYTVYTESSPTIATTNTTYEIAFDARGLNENPPTDLNFKIAYTTSDPAVHYIELNAVEWTTGYTATTAGARPLKMVTQEQMRWYLSVRNNVSSGRPLYAGWHHDTLFLDPSPANVYEIYGDYLKDSTRDDTTGEEITVAATGTETNEWFRRGQGILEMLALSIYAMQRAQNESLAQFARLQFMDQLKAVKTEAGIKSFKEKQPTMYI